MTEDAFLSAHVRRFSGFADTYHRYRPTPPAALVDLLIQLGGSERPALVVDLGSGTGLSTTLWANRAAHVVGVEPNDDMRAVAAAFTTAPNVEYRAGFAHETGLPGASADIVTVSQALHWMEPETTLAEVVRLLRPGGVFAAYDADFPPAVHWEAEAAFERCHARAAALIEQRGLARDVTPWPKSEHLARMRASGLFRHVREVVLHSVEQGNAERLVGLALSQGHVEEPLKHGATEDEVGLTDLRAVAQRVLGETPRPWYFSYRVRLGIR